MKKNNKGKENEKERKHGSERNGEIKGAWLMQVHTSDEET